MALTFVKFIGLVLFCDHVQGDETQPSAEFSFVVLAHCLLFDSSMAVALTFVKFIGLVLFCDHVQGDETPPSAEFSFVVLAHCLLFDSSMVICWTSTFVVCHFRGVRSIFLLLFYF